MKLVHDAEIPARDEMFEQPKFERDYYVSVIFICSLFVGCIILWGFFLWKLWHL